eukprot:8042355-Ditylum_brightwellii.AAC.1
MNLTFSSPPPPTPVFEQTNDRYVERHYFIPDDSEADMISGNGSAKAPFFIRANFDFPERHMPFQVLSVPKVIHDEYEFDVLDTSLCIDLGDANSWEA